MVDLEHAAFEFSPADGALGALMREQFLFEILRPSLAARKARTARVGWIAEPVRADGSAVASLNLERLKWDAQPTNVSYGARWMVVVVLITQFFGCDVAERENVIDHRLGTLRRYGTKSLHEVRGQARLVLSLRHLIKCSIANEGLPKG